MEDKEYLQDEFNKYIYYDKHGSKFIRFLVNGEYKYRSIETKRREVDYITSIGLSTVDSTDNIHLPNNLSIEDVIEKEELSE